MTGKRLLTKKTIELHAPTSSTQKLKLMGRGGQFTYIPTASPSSTSPVPVVAAASTTTPTFARWHCRLGHLSSSRLPTLVGSGVLGPVSGDAALHCICCKLGKQLQLVIIVNDIFWSF